MSDPDMKRLRAPMTGGVCKDRGFDSIARIVGVVLFAVRMSH